MDTIGKKTSLKHSTRRCIQWGMALFLLYIGYQFYQYAQWAQGLTEAYHPRPSSVEAFLPISAFLAVKHLVLTGQYDAVHPAGLSIFLFALVTALFLRKSFCGYLCPFGLASNIVSKLGERWLDQWPLRSWWGALAQVPKYLLLGTFFWLIWVNMSLADIKSFMQSPYNRIADTKMLLLFMPPSQTTLLVLLGIFLLTLSMRNIWCRCLCPYGALLGLLSYFSPIAIQRDTKACIHCKKCTEHCPSAIEVHTLERVNSSNCLACNECSTACPVENCLEMKLGYTKKAKRVPWYLVPALLLLGLFFMFHLAVATEKWQGNSPPELLRELHKSINRISH